jgi:alginate O-acetyltransferase complex protein AlgJ
MHVHHQPREIIPGPTQTAPPLSDREAQANAEVGVTDISRPLAWTLTLFLLAIIFAVPVVQLVHTRQPLEIGPLLGKTARVQLAGEGTLLARLRATNAGWLRDIKEYEDRLEEEALSSRAVRPTTQAVLTRWFGAGNEKVYVWRDGWLFYRPDVEFLTNPAKADPLPAIREFHRQLQARGIRLILLPVPAKPMIHPTRQDWPTIYRQLAQAGVEVFDALPLATEYLRTDTHWRPETMERVASALVERLRNLPAVDALDFTETTRVVTNVGDTAAMLELPFPPETVTIRQVRRNGKLWEPDESADVLLLGDSFANIYSFGEMKWGRGAGLAERLSFHLKRPVDALTRNDNGAHATRLMLAQQPERLTGKRVVIWQFAARELASGDWKLLPTLGP